LPKEVKKIVPIDTTKIVKAPDSIRSIVSDRLNVALMGENKNLGSFATKFKELYPGTDYQIIYYDTLTYRLQLQIPAEKREQIKKELPEKLKAFKPIVWHESLFQRNFTPSDPGFRDANKSWYHKQVKAIEAWDLVKGDSSLVIAVIDDGFDLSHPEFQGKIHKPWNVYTKSGAVNVGRKSFHGTHVAGIAVGAGGNGQGVSGIALNCKLMPIQVGDYDGTMGFTAIIDGILYAIHNGAKVVNMSLGMMIDKNTAKLPVAKQEEIVRTMFREEEQFWQQIFKAAYEKNIIFVLAAGNQNLLIGIDPFQRSKHTIKISATDINNRKANFSNFGDKSTLSAPGVQIYSSLPNGQFGNLDGTSMAAPIVAGGIALIKSANPALSFDQVVELLQNTALPVQNNAPYIGKIIQLDRALGIARDKRKENPKVDCPNVQDRIDSLLQVIEKLKKECAVNDETGDTLRLPAKENGERSDFSFAQGRWKSTTYIQDLTTGEPVTIYFDFLASGAGKITLIQSDNTNCSADLALSMGEGSLDINQTREAVCAPPPKTYSPYTFSCKPDANGYAECEAQNKTNTSNNFKFKLIKIR
jgi:hypothetical protein